MKQSLLSKKSLNDWLKKGQSALVDLFTVTLGMRKYWYALTEDLSKLYQRVEADELAQHVRTGPRCVRHHHDKPAGCIAITTTREMAKLFGGDKREPTWFSMERTHVDDATAGSDTLPELSVVSMDME